jgi:hypothetical protein
MIDDPVAGVHWILDPQTKTATKMPLIKTGLNGGVVPPPPAGDSPVFFATNVTPAGPVEVTLNHRDDAAKDPQVSTSDLGSQKISGLTATGTKTTRTFPVGALGNELPMVITSETWYSPDLRVIVMSKTNDPRTGDVTYELKNVQSTEPPATLFQVPADFTVKDQPNNLFYFQKKNNE